MEEKLYFNAYVFTKFFAFNKDFSRMIKTDQGAYESF